MPDRPEPAPRARATTYWDYIRVEELLSLQRGIEPEGAALDKEEVLFITVHQVFELWFQLVLRELRAARDLFTTDPVAEQELSNAVRSLKRVATVLRSAIDHFEVVETLPTREYLGFRDKLMPASGFQSAQLREIEIVFGLPAEERIEYGLDIDWLSALESPDGGASPARARVERALEDGPTLKVAIEEWLLRTPIDGVEHDAPEAEEQLAGFLGRFLEASDRELDLTCARALTLATTEKDREKLRARYEAEKRAVRGFFDPEADGADARRTRVRAAMLFIETYRDLPLLAWPREVLDGLVEVEQLFVVFRQRHARMVERVIGRRTGTGGSAGVDYLDATARKYRVFRDLWAIRTLQVRREAAPELERPGYYGFQHGV